MQLVKVSKMLQSATGKGIKKGIGKAGKGLTNVGKGLTRFYKR